MGTPARASGMSTAGRAALAVAMLVGFHLLAAGPALGVLGADLALVLESGRLNPAVGKLILLSLAVAYPVLRVVFLTRRPREQGEPHGLLVTRDQQPEPWARVDRIAERTGVRGPAEIRLIPEAEPDSVLTHEFGSWSTAAVLHLPDGWDGAFAPALDAAVADTRTPPPYAPC
jgi:hypothetical protein